MVAMGSAQEGLVATTDQGGQANGFTPWPARAWVRRTESPLVWPELHRFRAHPNRGCSCGLKPPVSSSDLAM